MKMIIQVSVNIQEVKMFDKGVITSFNASNFERVEDLVSAVVDKIDEHRNENFFDLKMVAVNDCDPATLEDDSNPAAYYERTNMTYRNYVRGDFGPHSYVFYMMDFTEDLAPSQAYKFWQLIEDRLR